MLQSVLRNVERQIAQYQQQRQTREAQLGLEAQRKLPVDVHIGEQVGGGHGQEGSSSSSRGAAVGHTAVGSCVAVCSCCGMLRGSRVSYAPSPQQASWRVQVAGCCSMQGHEACHTAGSAAQPS
jgi:hypothetical protein